MENTNVYMTKEKIEAIVATVRHLVATVRHLLLTYFAGAYALVATQLLLLLLIVAKRVFGLFYGDE
jgi:hypothetical protein